MNHTQTLTTSKPETASSALLRVTRSDWRLDGQTQPGSCGIQISKESVFSRSAMPAYPENSFNPGGDS